ncbi:unnamed protein product [Symbiodinium sp. CCMP2456]|nr:unnamed protein product [Symbiodinium sp. CCMP2456]
MVRLSKLLVAGSLLGNVLADTGNLGQLCGADEAACSCNWAGDSESMNTSTKSLRSGTVTVEATAPTLVEAERKKEKGVRGRGPSMKVMRAQRADST